MLLDLLRFYFSFFVSLFSQSRKKKISFGKIHYPFLSSPKPCEKILRAPLFQIIQHEAEYTSAPYKCIINFCSLGSFLHHLLLLMEEKNLEKKFFVCLL